MGQDISQAGTGELTAQAMNVADLVNYQEGSVVSRTIIDKKTGTVTVFAFDEGQGLSEHTAPFDALVYIIDGEAEIVISGKANQLKDQMIIMPANLILIYFLNDEKMNGPKSIQEWSGAIKLMYSYLGLGKKTK